MRSPAELLEEARQLPREEQTLIAEALIGDAHDLWQQEVGDPEPGYEEWFRAGVEEALADNSPGIPHEKAMRHFRDGIVKARNLKATAESKSGSVATTMNGHGALNHRALSSD